MSEPKFNLSEGKGTPLGQLPCFTTAKRQSNKLKALEGALEPLHRIVYGRPGITGERKYALEDFRGFPESMKADVREKMGNLTKSKLRELIVGLGMRVHISQAHAQVADDVTEFLMKPRDDGVIKAEGATQSGSATKRTRSSSGPSRNAAAAAAEEHVSNDDRDAVADVPTAKRPKQEPAPAKPTPPAVAAGPTEDAVRVQVYRRVLAMTPQARATLGVKQLRTELEAHFKVKDGDLKRFKEVITETASDCVRALLEAEERARGEEPPDTSSSNAHPAPAVEAPASPAAEASGEDLHKRPETVPAEIEDAVPPPL